MKNYTTKICGVALVFNFISIGSNAQTILNGVISANSTLTLANSPYQVTGNLLIYPNVTLTVEPGVVVKFNSNIGILLRGKIVAIGTASDTITFSSDIHSLGSWQGITIDNYQNAKVEFSYLKGKFANQFINNSNTYGTGDTVIKFTNCFLDSNNTVEYANAHSNSTQYYAYCTFSHNGVVNYSYLAASCILKNCLCYNNYRVIYNTEFNSPPSTVDSCIIHDNTEGLEFEHGSITNSTFYNNGIAISHDNPGPDVHYCNIYQNTQGIHSWHTIANAANLVTYNRICNNNYNVYINWAADFNAPNNCWCLNDSAQIRSTMYDFFVSFSLGVVNYSPFDTTCSFFSDVQSIIKSSFSFQIYPNPLTSSSTLQLTTQLKDAEVIIYDMLGKEMMRKKLTGDRMEIERGSLVSGVYFVRVRSEERQWVEKVVVE